MGGSSVPPVLCPCCEVVVIIEVSPRRWLGSEGLLRACASNARARISPSSPQLTFTAVVGCCSFCS